MPRVALVCGAIVLVAHGLIHLMGTSVYLRLAELQGLPSRSVLLVTTLGRSSHHDGRPPTASRMGKSIERAGL
jgi:hypothetical protein